MFSEITQFPAFAVFACDCRQLDQVPTQSAAPTAGGMTPQSSGKVPLDRVRVSELTAMEPIPPATLFKAGKLFWRIFCACLAISSRLSFTAGSHPKSWGIRSVLFLCCHSTVLLEFL